MASNTVNSISSGQARLSWRKRLIGALDRFIDRQVKAAEHVTERDRQQRKVLGIRPSLVFLTE
jgi:hypothetical protein